MRYPIALELHGVRRLVRRQRRLYSNDLLHDHHDAQIIACKAPQANDRCRPPVCTGSHPSAFDAFGAPRRRSSRVKALRSVISAASADAATTNGSDAGRPGPLANALASARSAAAPNMWAFSPFQVTPSRSRSATRTVSGAERTCLLPEGLASGCFEVCLLYVLRDPGQSARRGRNRSSSWGHRYNRKGGRNRIDKLTLLLHNFDATQRMPESYRGSMVRAVAVGNAGLATMFVRHRKAAVSTPRRAKKCGHSRGRGRVRPF
jgi:hypothetical protein